MCSVRGEPHIWLQFGIVSNHPGGPKVVLPDGRRLRKCDESHLLYVRVAAYRDWIVEKMRKWDDGELVRS